MVSINFNEMVEIIKRKHIRDERGWLLKTLTGKESGLPNYTGEIYTVCGYPNQIRGGHYHQIATEWFTLITGQALLKLKDINSDEEESIFLSADKPVTIVVPPYIAHQFESVDDNEFILLAYANYLYDPADTFNWSFPAKI
jgi:dTDP-4-dehydrorhamnose 3,5-epimerase-like enzyme